MSKWKGTLCMSGAMLFSVGLMGGPALPAYGAVSMEPAMGPPLLAEKPRLGPAAPGLERTQNVKDKPQPPSPDSGEQGGRDGGGDRDTILVRIFTDSYGNETTWEITNSAGNVVASGGPYGDNTLYEIFVAVYWWDCYDFCIYDAYGDGICCDAGNGWYEVLYQGAVVGSGGEFTYTECVDNIGPDCDNAVFIEIMTDNFGYETTWDLRDQYGTIFFSDGPLEDNELYQYEIGVDGDGCYDFCIYDSFGDGICCDYGYGWYEVTYIEGSSGWLVGSGGEFGYVECVNDIGEGCCPEAEVVVEIVTDTWPGETTWVLREHDTAVVVCSGGPYPLQDDFYTYTCCVEADGCYHFTIYDSYGDGIWAPGGYAVYYDGALVYSCIGSGWHGAWETVADIGMCVPADFTVTAPYTSPIRTTCGAGNDCGLRWTEEHEYQVTIPYAGTWSFNTCPYSGLDTYIFLGTSLCTQNLGYNDDACGLQSEIIATVGPGTYYCTIEGYSGCGDYIFDVYDIDAVPNDDCANAIPIYDGATPYHTTGATTDGPAHPECQFDGQTYHDIWYEYVATCTGDLTVSMCQEYGGDARYDTDLVVYDGCDCDNLVLLGCNDDATVDCTAYGTIYASHLVVPVVQGNCYLIRIGGYYSGSVGAGIISITCQPEAPPNDDCVNATPIGDVADLPFDTTNATFDGPGLCQTAPNVWYCYTATCTGMLSVDTCGSQYDTIIAVYDGCDCYPTDEQMLCCNDDHCCEDAWVLQSRCLLWVEQGRQYLIEVGGYASYNGPGDLTVRCEPCDYFYDDPLGQGGGNGWPYPDGPGEWIYTPDPGWWNMWWPNELAPNREKLVRIEFDVEFPCRPPDDPYNLLQVVINWTTPEWTDPAAPPTDDAFIARAPDPPIDIVEPGHYEFEMTLPYCPAWVSMDVRGYDFVITGTIDHECLPGEPDYVVTAPYTSPLRTTCGAGNDCALRATEEHEYQVTIPYASTWSFNTCAYSGLDTYIFLGTSLCTQDLGYNDDACGEWGWQSEVLADIGPGTYYCTVEGYGTCGEYIFDVYDTLRPPNDDCVNATPIGDVVDLPFDTTYATFDGSGWCMSSPNIWYCYTATCTGMLSVDVCGSEYDTMIAVYDGCECYPTYEQLLCCNDDHCCEGDWTLQSRCLLWVEEGHEYLIEVGHYWVHTGAGDLTVQCHPADYYFDSGFSQGGGNGWPYPQAPGEWVYYPSDWWNMWWPNEFDPERVKVLYVEFDVEFPCMPTYPDGWLEVVVNWSTPQWADPDQPPFDDAFIERAPDPPIYITEPGHYTLQVILPYCPWWISVDVRGDWFVIDGTIRHECVCFGSLNGDNDVDLIDLAQLLAHYGCATCSYWEGDFDSDGDVDLSDLAILLADYGTTCGPDGMVFVPAGEFQMGDTFDEGVPSELPVHPVYVDAFYMDTYEVTNQQYADRLNWAWAQGNLITVMGGVVYQHGSGTSYPYCDTYGVNNYSRIHWDGATFTVTAGKEDHAIVEVSWYGSVAYCNWRSAMEGRPPCYDLSNWTCNFGVPGYRLATEAEWERAARGGTPGHRFPWSDQDTIQHARCNYNSALNCFYDTSPTHGYHPLWGVGSYPYTSPVGFFTGALQYKADWGWPGSPDSYQTDSGANDYGLHDMAGNVFEWCNDWYDGTYYSSSPYDNPQGPTTGDWRVLRGGSWSPVAHYSRVAYRAATVPDARNYHSGFRLVLEAE